MGLRRLIKKALKRADEITDREGDRLEIVTEKLSKTGHVIADDAKYFAKKTYHNLKDVAGDITEVSKDATRGIRDKAKDDFNDVKEIAEKRMHETRDIIQEKLVSSKKEVENIVEDVKDETSDIERNIKDGFNNPI
ncbi:hypothetical protein [Faecalibacter rhinopitheci]|uniref:Uncharacterized protein n=1 Tax=Faecalibacter rhinopitheci TaxID=2779678 RepID=A0A8J7FQ28_9FLAO|nr:hypothetical protein [Faecalibacter rhinopitheci]MBF0597585.1 hypothetical protein [Faecalibacter rhinopitheci]